MAKKIYLIIGMSAALFIIPSYAQNTFPQVGKVGVGTTSPAEELEVIGDVRIDGLKHVSSQPNAAIGLRYVMVDEAGKLIPGEVKPAPSPGGMGGGGGNPQNADACSSNLRGRLNSSYNTNTFQICNGVTLTNSSNEYGAFSLAFEGNANITNSLVVGVSGYNWTPSNMSSYILDSKLFVQGNAFINGSLETNDFRTISLNAQNISANNFNISNISVTNSNVSNKLKVGAMQPTGSNTDYKLSVDGKAVFKEAVVTLDNWADFVFENNYKLRKLEEVEAFIKENHHLPDVPSEKEVKENGVSLGEMDAILLQKIEELTLYMIELKKENEALKKEVQKIKK